MQQIILKNEISLPKIEAIINFLKSWDIDAEFKTIKNKPKTKSKIKDITLMSQDSLAKDWLTPEEDKAWENL